jgi:hypothetical protein
MIRLASILLSFYFLAGSVLLPKGDFGFTGQLPKLYDAFVQVNGTVTFNEFLEEELLEAYSFPEYESKNDPDEKECHPVPINSILVNANSTLDIPLLLILSKPEIIMAIAFSPYLENFLQTDPYPYFHPPRLC